MVSAWMSGALPPEAIRVLKAAIAVALALLVFWLLSTFVLTLDRLQSEWIRWTYIGLAALLALTVAAFVRQVLRGEPSLASDETVTYPATRPSAERIKELYARHRLDEGETTVSASPSMFGGASRSLRIAVAGTPDVGKTALTRRLAAALSGHRISAELTELPALSATQSANRDLSELAAAFDVLVLAVDQDFRDYEMAFLDAVHASAIPAVVAVTKSDRLSSVERAELAASLARRLSGLKPTVDVVFTSADPLPVLAEVTAADGRVSEVERQRPSDVKALLGAVQAAVKRTK